MAQTDEEFCKNIPYMTSEENVRTKDWACGPREPMENHELVIRGSQAKFEKITYTPAWWKIIDEPIVNALDHFVKCRVKTPTTPVTKIKIWFEPDGRVKIFNDGPGIPIRRHPEASKIHGKDILLPTFFFGMLNQGGNHCPAPDSITGGVNGFGAKLAIINAVQAVLETVDSTGKFFQQRWENNMMLCHDPVVIEKPPASWPLERRKPHTTLSFMPDYVKSLGYSAFTPAIYDSHLDVVRTRAWFAAAYVVYTCGQDIGGKTARPNAQCKVYFNDVELKVSSFCNFVDMLFPTYNCLHTIIPCGKSATYHFDWELMVVVGAFPRKCVGITNGIVTTAGTHLKAVTDQIVEAVHKKMAAVFKDKNIKFAPSRVTENMFVFLNSKIPLPKWDGQRKDTLHINKSCIAEYEIPAPFIEKLCAQLHDYVLDSILTIADKAASANTDVNYDKYQEAGWANKTRARETSLIFVEGDSAFNQVKTAVANQLGSEKYGIISTKGVPMNARKQYTIVRGRVQFMPKLKKNAFIPAFIRAVGLDENAKYDPTSATYKDEMKALRYGSVTACVDQDLDGKGKILGTILAMFEAFWPNLLAAGFVRWFTTPIIRAKIKQGREVKSFYRENEYEEWLKTVDATKYKVKYYKGIGSHSAEESKHMFSLFAERTYLLYCDERSHDLFEIYYGKDADKRKVKLATVARMLTMEDISAQDIARKVSCSDMCEIETHEFQLDDLDRKLSHLIDGQNQAGRKVLDGIMKLIMDGEEIKVDKFAGAVLEKENYQHGVASLSETIIGKSFIAPGGVQLPFLTPASNSGTREEGGKDHAKTRYAGIFANVKLLRALFSQEEYRLLDFNFDEGSRGEPKYFIPLLPLATLESEHMPGHGWAREQWARDVFVVIMIVRNMIANENALITPPPATYAGTDFAWNGTFRYIRGKMHSFGKYSLNGNDLTITELPLCVWTLPWKDTMTDKIAKNMMIGTDKKKYPLVKSIDTSQCSNVIKIHIKLAPGALDQLENFGDMHFTDGIEEFFNLHKVMHDQHNYINIDGSVLTLRDYTDIIQHWFPLRRDMYARRVHDQQTILQLRIKLQSNICRYIEETAKLRISGKKTAAQIETLRAAKYDMIDRKLIGNPLFIPTDELPELVMHGAGASYSYLLEMRDCDRSEESILKKQEKLKRLRRELEELTSLAGQGAFIGAEIFRRELDELEKVIKEGFATRWEFENYGRYDYK